MPESGRRTGVKYHELIGLLTSPGGRSVFHPSPTIVRLGQGAASTVELALPGLSRPSVCPQASVYLGRLGGF